MNYLHNFNHQILGQARRGRLVFLHGLMGSVANWRKIITAFSDDFEILLFDQRGHGRSIQPPVEMGQGYRPEDYAEDLRQILDDLQWNSIHLVGHSMGGRNALNFAHRFPQRVIKLVIEDIGPDANAKAIAYIHHLLKLVPTPFANKKAARQFFLEEFARLIPNDPQKDVLAQYFYTNIEEKPDGTADWRFFKAGILASVDQGRSRDRWEEVAGLKMPTLVIRGQNSVELSPEIFERMVKSNPLLEGVEIPDSGHWVHFDQPQAFMDSVRSFLLRP